tara:strand:+ start:2781 stop:3431 length:651 start_codon:yes stop_codon:yes gene_type:complete
MITKEMLNYVLPYLDFTNEENNIKKRDNKKSAYKLKMLKNDSKDLLTQMTKLFHDKIMYQPVNIVQSTELTRENIELKEKLEKCNKENERLKNKLSKSNKLIKDLENELNEYDITVNNLDNEIIKLKEKYIIPPSKLNNITDNTPSVLDEPVYYDNNTNYDPYNTTYNIPITVNDITSRDIENIITYYGLGYDEWNDMDDIEKVNYYNEYQTKTDK